MSDTPRTKAAIRQAVINWGRGEYADAHIIEDLTEFTEKIERELSAAAERIAQLETDLERARLNHVDANTRNMNARDALENVKVERDDWHNLADERSAEIVRLAGELGNAQAKIDALMLEYCPDEMTPKQVERWGVSQAPATETPAGAFKRGMKRAADVCEKRALKCDEMASRGDEGAAYEASRARADAAAIRAAAEQDEK